MALSQLYQCTAEIRADWSADDFLRRRQAALRAQAMLRALVSELVLDNGTQAGNFANGVCDVTGIEETLLRRPTVAVFA